MPAEQWKRSEQVVTTIKEQLGPLAIEAIGEKGFADLTVIIQEALQRERADVAGQFEALAKALQATTEPVDLGL